MALKAHQYFNCDEEIVKLLFDNLNSEEKELFIKKWGKDLDGINITRQLKKTDLANFTELVEKFKKDILYVSDLKKSGKTNNEIKNILDSKKNKKINKLEELMVTYNTSKETILEAIEKLEKNKRYSFIYFYGIERSRLPISKISDILQIDEKEVKNDIDKANLYLASYIKCMKENKEKIKQNSEVEIIKPKATLKPKFIDKTDQEKVITPVIEKKEVNIEIKEDIKIVDEIENKINLLEISDIEKIILYLKAKGNKNEIISKAINCSIQEIIFSYIKHLDIFDDPSEMIEEAILYNVSNVIPIYQTNYIKKIIMNMSLREKYDFFVSLEQKNNKYSEVKELKK